MEQTINEFIKEVIEALVRENSDRECYREKKVLNIPFIISVIKQKLEREEFKQFLNDINSNNYDIEFEDYNDGWLGYGKIIVSLYNKECDEDDNFSYSSVDYQYVFQLTMDQRDWGYCQCEPKDYDYRKDKKCCGHGCDWSAPAFRLVKEVFVSHEESWEGDQHDYWEFEDAFYKSDKELAEEKAKKDRDNKIKLLQDNISSMQKELDKLLNT